MFECGNCAAKGRDQGDLETHILDFPDHVPLNPRERTPVTEELNVTAARKLANRQRIATALGMTMHELFEALR